MKKHLIDTKIKAEKPVQLLDCLTPTWKVNTPGFLKEICGNPQVAPIQITFQIFADILYEVATRASELNDDKLNALMCRLSLYEISDPYNNAFDRELFHKVLAKAGWC